MCSRSFVIALLIPFLSSIPAFSQTAAAKNATAVSLMSNAVRALSQGTPISTVTLTAMATRTAGSDVETGEATLETLGGVDSRINLTLTNGQRSKIINQSQGAAAGQWSGTNGTAHALAFQNTLTPAAWFFPALALAPALNNPSVAVSYLGQETLDGQTVSHVRFWHVFPSANNTAATLKALENLTAADVYLNASDSLPVELDFNIHPDKNASLNIPVEIRYSNYQKMNGILLPTHIEKLINHSLFLDLHVTGATTNTTLSPADFAVTAQKQ